MKSDYGKRAFSGWTRAGEEAMKKTFQKYKQIPLTQGKFAIVDEEDFDSLVVRSWCVHGQGKNWYAIGHKDGKQIKMHREILGLTSKDKVYVDHINHNGLDNRKCNLRICNNRKNQANQLIRPGGSSPYKGVRYKNGKWESQINYHGKSIYIGRFNNDIDAAKASDKKALELNGEFSLLNFPEKYCCPTCSGLGYINEKIKCSVCMDKGYHLDWCNIQKKFIKTSCLFCGSGRTD